MATPTQPPTGSAAPTAAVEHAHLAILAAHRGDPIAARTHVASAQLQTRATTRRHRQIIEIAALVVAGSSARAAGLVLEHTTEFPDDIELLAHVSRA